MLEIIVESHMIFIIQWLGANGYCGSLPRNKAAGVQI